MSSRSPVPVEAFRHEALLYEGKQGFLEGLVPFIREGITRDEPTLVVVGAEKIGWLRDSLGGADADRVQFADMASVGANPARIIPAWRDFVDRHAAGSRRLCGIGEPIYPQRKSDELLESQRHEALLNLAFDGSPAWWLICPYDTTALAGPVIDEAHRTHPFVSSNGEHVSSLTYAVVTATAPFIGPLPEPRRVQATVAFSETGLQAVRRTVSREAGRAGFTTAPIAELVMAVNEVATNSVRHGGGSGTLRVWRDGPVLLCEVRDSGQLQDPLADRRRPVRDQDGGRGFWLANQLCGLVQVRSYPAGTTVRLHMQRDRRQ